MCPSLSVRDVNPHLPPPRATKASHKKPSTPQMLCAHFELRSVEQLLLSRHQTTFSEGGEIPLPKSWLLFQWLNKKLLWGIISLGNMARRKQSACSLKVNSAALSEFVSSAGPKLSRAALQGSLWQRAFI